MSEITFLKYLSEKQLQRRCAEFLDSTPVGDFSKINLLLRERSGLSCFFDYATNFEPEDVDPFSLIRSYFEFGKKEPILRQKQTFQKVLGVKILTICENQNAIQKQLNKIVSKNLTIDSPVWSNSISIVYDLLQKLKAQIQDLSDCDQFEVLHPPLESILSSRCEKEIQERNKELARFGQLLRSNKVYPVEDFFTHLPEIIINNSKQYPLNEENGLVHLPGNVFRIYTELYFKLQEELVKARKIRPPAQLPNQFPRKTIADFLREKMEFAEAENTCSESDKLKKIETFKLARKRILEKI